MAQKKYVTLSRLSTFLDNLNNKFSALGHKHTIADLTDYTVDSSLSPNSNNPVANSVIDAEFEAISTAMGALESAIDGKAEVSHNHNDDYDAKGSADAAIEAAKSYTDTKTANLASTTYVDISIENIPVITNAEIDEICGIVIYSASEVEV